MNESSTPQPFYKQKQWIIAIVIVVIAAIGIGVFAKQAADEKSRTDAKTAAADYKKAAPGDFDKVYALVTNDAAPTENDVKAIEKAISDRPRLKEVKGVGVEEQIYKDAKQLDEKVGAYYAKTLSNVKKEFLPFTQYSAAIENFATAREQAAASINESGGNAAAAVTAIRTKAIPTVQASLDAFKKTAAPSGAEKLTALVEKTHQDFIGGLEGFAKEIESGGAIQNRDFSEQINQINTELQTLSQSIGQKVETLKTEGAALKKQLE